MHFFRILTLAGVLLAACASGAADPAPHSFELTRFVGRWHVLAHVPGLGENGPRAHYVEFNPQGSRVEERRYAGAASGPQLLAAATWVVDEDRPTRWHEDSWWPASDKLTVLYVSADYRQALVDAPGGPRVLSRDLEVPEWVYAGLLGRLAALGYDVAKLRRTAQ